jgi:hypothetical protein
MVEAPISLISANGPEHNKFLGRVDIDCKSASADGRLGNYRVVLVNFGGKRAWRTGELKSFPRLPESGLGGYDLVYRALRATVGTRNPEPWEATKLRVRGEGVEIVRELARLLADRPCLRDDEAEAYDRARMWLANYARDASPLPDLPRTREGTVEAAWETWSYEAAKKTGLLCRECHTAQVESPGGVVCQRGHGGAEGYRPHKYHNCNDPTCNVCNGGLQWCEVCGEGEATLADECPGPK